MVIPKYMESQLKAKGYEQDPIHGWWQPIGDNSTQVSLRDLERVKGLEDIPRILAVQVPSDYRNYVFCEVCLSTGVWINRSLKPFLTTLLELDWDAKETV